MSIVYEFIICKLSEMIFRQSSIQFFFFLFFLNAAAVEVCNYERTCGNQDKNTFNAVC